MKTLLSTMLFIGGLALGFVTLFVGAMQGVWPFGEERSAGPILFGVAVSLAVVYLAVVGCLRKGKARTIENMGWLLVMIVSAFAVVTGMGTLKLVEPNIFIGRSQLIIGSVIGILALLQVVFSGKGDAAANH
jgi:hypothetical protein